MLRIKKILMLNSLFSGVFQIVKIFFTFVNRKIFIYYLGIFYVGLNNLFSDMLNMLSLAELGVGVAITCALYKPLAEDSLGKVRAYMKLYAKIYCIIGIVIFILGLLLTPFLHLFLKGTPVSSEILTIYLLILTNISIDYFFSHRSALIVANQKNYLLYVIELISFVSLSLLQWLGLWMTRSVIIYLILALVCRFITNLVIIYFAKKEVDLSDVAEIPLTPEEKQELKDNTLGTLINSLAAVIVFQTDSLIISYFASVIILGLYSNYAMLIASVLGTLGKIMESIVPSVRHLIVRGDDKKVKALHKKILYYNFLISYLASLGFYALASDFVILWLGERYIIAPLYIFLITLSKFITSIRVPNLKFSSAYVLYSKHKVKCVIESLANLVFSLLLAGTFQLGLAGVLLGTILSSVLVAGWWEAFILYRYGFKESPLNYLPLVCKSLITWLVGLGMVTVLSQKLVFEVTLWTLCLKGLVIFLVLMLVFVIFYIRDTETRNNIRILKNKIMRKTATKR